MRFTPRAMSSSLLLTSVPFIQVISREIREPRCTNFRRDTFTSSLKRSSKSVSVERTPRSGIEHSNSAKSLPSRSLSPSTRGRPPIKYPVIKSNSLNTTSTRKVFVRACSKLLGQSDNSRTVSPTPRPESRSSVSSIPSTPRCTSPQLTFQFKSTSVSPLRDFSLKSRSPSPSSSSKERYSGAQSTRRAEPKKSVRSGPVQDTKYSSTSSKFSLRGKTSPTEVNARLRYSKSNSSPNENKSQLRTSISRNQSSERPTPISKKRPSSLPSRISVSTNKSETVGLSTSSTQSARREPTRPTSQNSAKATQKEERGRKVDSRTSVSRISSLRPPHETKSSQLRREVTRASSLKVTKSATREPSLDRRTNSVRKDKTTRKESLVSRSNTLPRTTKRKFSEKQSNVSKDTNIRSSSTDDEQRKSSTAVSKRKPTLREVGSYTLFFYNIQS